MQAGAHGYVTRPLASTDRHSTAARSSMEKMELHSFGGHTGTDDTLPAASCRRRRSHPPGSLAHQCRSECGEDRPQTRCAGTCSSGQRRRWHDGLWSRAAGGLRRYLCSHGKASYVGRPAVRQALSCVWASVTCAQDESRSQRRTAKLRRTLPAVPCSTYLASCRASSTTIMVGLLATRLAWQKECTRRPPGPVGMPAADTKMRRSASMRPTTAMGTCEWEGGGAGAEWASLGRPLKQSS